MPGNLLTSAGRAVKILHCRRNIPENFLHGGDLPVVTALGPGELTVSADLFCPLKWDSSELTKLFSKLCTAVEKYNITSISAENITADTNTQAYMLKTSITFYNKFDFGGDE